MPDARVLDLFAGTGAYGIEALSRGAKSALFIEQNSRTAEALQQNLTSLEYSFAEKLFCESGIVFLLFGMKAHVFQK